MIDKKNISITILVGFLTGLLIIQPFAISLFEIDTEGSFNLWWQSTKAAFNQIVAFGDSVQIFKNILFGVLGSALGLMYYIGLKRK